MKKINTWNAVLTTVASFCVLGMYGAIASIFFLHSPEVIAQEEVLSPRDYLRQQCVEPECDFWLLDKIAECESNWRMVKNGRSSAYGFFQILDSTERTTPQWQAGESKYDPYSNIDMAIHLYETRGWQPWYPSKHCWSGKYTHQTSNLPGACLGHGCKE